MGHLNTALDYAHTAQPIVVASLEAWTPARHQVPWRDLAFVEPQLTCQQLLYAATLRM